MPDAKAKSKDVLPPLDEIESLAASVLKGAEHNRYWREHVALVAKDANLLCIEVRRLRRREELLVKSLRWAMKHLITHHPDFRCIFCGIDSDDGCKPDCLYRQAKVALEGKVNDGKIKD